MANVFERLASSTRGTVEKVHGKSVTVYRIERLDVNSPPKISAADQPYQTFACFFSDTMTRSEADMQPIANGGRLMHRSLRLQASIRVDAGMKLSTGDIIKRDEDGAIFSVQTIDPDGLGGFLCDLAAAKSLPETAGA